MSLAADVPRLQPIRPSIAGLGLHRAKHDLLEGGPD